MVDVADRRIAEEGEHRIRERRGSRSERVERPERRCDRGAGIRAQNVGRRSIALKQHRRLPRSTEVRDGGRASDALAKERHEGQGREGNRPVRKVRVGARKSRAASVDEEYRARGAPRAYSLVRARDEVRHSIAVEITECRSGKDPRVGQRARGVNRHRPSCDGRSRAVPRVDVPVECRLHDVGVAVTIEIGEHGACPGAACERVIAVGAMHGSGEFWIERARRHER